MTDSKYINHSLEKLGNGIYRITIAIDTRLIESEISGRLENHGPSASESFDSVFSKIKNEVINDIIRTSFEDAALTYGASPASAPSIRVLSDSNESFIFAATFDVTPTVDLTSLSAIRISCPVVEVTENDLEYTMALLLNQSTDKKGVYESFGIMDGEEEAFRREVLLNLQREADLCEREIKKQTVISRLTNVFKIELPESMVNAEIERLKSSNTRTDNGTLSESDLRLQAIEILKRRIIINAVVQKTRLSLQPQVVRQYLDRIATAYEDPQQVIQHYYSNRVELAGIEAKVIEDQVIDWLIQECQQSLYKVSFTDAVNILKQKEH